MTTTKMGPIELDRAAGVIVAAAAGDASGAGYEFRAPCPATEVEMRQGALTGRPAGSWTDDTDMAICIAEVAATGERLDLSIEGRGAVALRFKDWYESHPPDIGNHTRAVLAQAIGANPEPPLDGDWLSGAALDYQNAHPNSAGNGSLMRTGPVAVAGLGDDAQLMRTAAAISALTHAHDRAITACQLWCIAIDRAIREGRLDGIHDGIALLGEEEQSFWREVVHKAETAPIEELRNNGFVVTALQAAWRAIVSTSHLTGPEHLEAGLRAAVAIGGDTDTVAAIAGALLGGRYGASAVPFAWRRRLQGWPPDVRHADLVEMGVLTARKGEVDSIGWPLVDDLLPYYQKQWHPSGHSVEIPGAEGITWGDMAGLPHARAKAFVTLCRIGRKQRRGNEHHQVWLMDDDQNADLGFVLADTADAIETLRNEVGSVFVHCVRAESRTPAIAAAWLIRHRGLEPDEAMAQVRRSMPQARPNVTMLAALRTLKPSRDPPVRLHRESRNWPEEVEYVTDSSDRGISAALNALSDAAWEELRTIAGRLEEADRRQAGWELVRFLYAEKLMVVFDWMHWQRFGQDPTQDPDDTIGSLRTASAEDALRLACGIARAERFSEGCIDAMADSGVLLAIMRRLLKWRVPVDDSEPSRARRNAHES